jgi:ankyrin repeat protein
MRALLRLRLRCAGLCCLLLLMLMPPAVQAGSYDDYFTAVKLDAPRELKALMARGLGPNLVEPQRGYTALMLAIREDSMNVVNLLLGTPGIDLEAQARNGDTPLMLAAFHGYLPLVKILLSRDVQVNRPGWTALHYAAINGNPEIIKVLLDASAYIDAESAEGRMTPIMLAAVRGRVAAVRVLQQEGADVTLKNADGMTVLDLARRFQQADVIDVLTNKQTPWSQQRPVE